MPQEFRGRSLGIFVGIMIVATALTICGTYYALSVMYRSDPLYKQGGSNPAQQN